jgi:23S rRNA 5-hydroxycytidine C2501 synthase
MSQIHLDMDLKKTLRRIELLAPAKDIGTGIAAINYGADAIYVGAPKFSARIAAGNSINDIAALIQYAHRYWAKVYVALNTILFDSELDEAQKIIRSLSEIGTDALIIQDMGILELDLPPIPLFASTQTHNYSLEKIQFLEKVGFQRAILARELSLRQLKEIRANTTFDLEFFIHGALCVSFSGQCYLSQAMQGRSANRGACAQPCRLPYTLTDSSGKILAKEKYLLSLKDLNLSEYIRELIDAGISSFKIEGRLKDVNYVKNITAFYRQRIDKILETDSSLSRASSGNTLLAFQPDPPRTFNRGFTDHFILHRNKDILSSNTPKSVGACLGKAGKIYRDHFVLKTSETLHSGDGICSFNQQELLRGTNINKVEGNRVYPSELKEIEEGTIIYRNYDHRFAKTLQGNKTKRLIGVKIQLKEIEKGFALTLEDEDNVKIFVVQEIEKTPAKNRVAAEDTVRRQLMKLGDSIFVSDKVDIIWSRPYFIPVSLCNKLRREAIAQLEEKRKQKLPQHCPIIVPNSAPYLTKRIDYSTNVANKKSEAFYRRHGVEIIEQAFELQQNRQVTLMTMKHCLRFQFGLCTGQGTINAESLFLQDAKNKYRLNFNCSVCQMKVVFEKTI